MSTAAVSYSPEDVEFSPAPAAPAQASASASASAGYSPDDVEFAPAKPAQGAPPAQPGIVSRAWNWANSPINVGHLRQSLDQAEADSNAGPTLEESQHPTATAIKKGVEGFGADAGKMLATPLSAALEATGGVAEGASVAAKAARAAMIASGIGFGAAAGKDAAQHGVTPNAALGEKGYSDPNYQRRVLQDAAMVTGGAAGAAGAVHELRGRGPASAVAPAAPSYSPDDVEFAPEDTTRTFTAPANAAGRTVVQGSTEADAIRASATDQQPTLNATVQGAVAGVPGADVTGSRVKDAESQENKADREKPVETQKDHLGIRIAADSPQAAEQAEAAIAQNHPVVGSEPLTNNGLDGKQVFVRTGKPGDANQVSEVQILPKEQVAALDKTDGLYDQQKQALARGDKAEADRLSEEITAIHEAANPKNAEDPNPEPKGGSGQSPEPSAAAAGARPAVAPLKIEKGSSVVLNDGTTGTVNYYPWDPKGRARVTTSDGRRLPSVPVGDLTPIPSPATTGGKWIGVDMDGTLAHYEGYKGPGEIGEPIPAMVDRVKQWIAEGKDVRIFTARIADDPTGEARKAIQAWSEQHLGRKLPVTNVKDGKMEQMWDDRAVQVGRNTGEALGNPEDAAASISPAKETAGGVHEPAPSGGGAAEGRAETSEAPAPRPEPGGGTGKGVGPSLKPGDVGRVRVADLKVDPKRFQYKLNTDEGGATAKLKDVAWNDALSGIVTAWRDPETGVDYVVNGHHRADLARRHGVDTLAVRMLPEDVRTAEQARTVGALQNIAEGQGTAIDAAKFLRDTGLAPSDLSRFGISLSGAVADGGMALSRLDQRLFDDVVAGRIPERRGIAIAKAAETPEQQDALVKLISRAESKGKTVTNATIEELGRMVKGSGEHTSTQDTLFGAQQRTQNLALEKAEVSAYLRNQIAQEKKLFAGLSSTAKADKIGEVGKNQIDAKENQKVASLAEQAQEIYDRLSTRTGPVNDILNLAAKRIAEGDNANTVKSEAYRSIRTALSEALRGGQEGGAGRVQEDDGRPAKASEVATPPKPTAADLAADLRARGKDVQTGDKLEDAKPGTTKRNHFLGIDEPDHIPLKMKDGTPFTLQRAFAGKYKAVDAEGTEIGSFSYLRYPDGELKMAGAEVEPNFKRKGVATAAYDALEKVIGGTFKDTGSQTNQGRAFWDYRRDRPKTAEEEAKPTAKELEDAGQTGMFARKKPSVDSMSLPGMGDDIERQSAAAKDFEGEEQRKLVESTLRQPAGDISKAAGEMERHSPLFYGTEAGGQSTLFDEKNPSWRGNPRFEAAGARSMPENLLRAKYEVKTEDGIPHLRLDEDAFFAFNKLLKMHTVWDGVTLDEAGTGSAAALINRTLAAAANAAASDFRLAPFHRAAARLADAFAKSRNENGHAILVGPDGDLDTIREENLHSWAIKFDLQPEIVDALADSPLLDLARKALVSYGYDLDEAYTVVAEATAKAAVLRDFLPAEDRRAILTRYAELLRDHGVDTARLPKIADDVADIFGGSHGSEGLPEGRAGDREGSSGAPADNPSLRPLQEPEGRQDRADDSGGGGEAEGGGKTPLFARSKDATGDRDESEPLSELVDKLKAQKGPRRSLVERFQKESQRSIDSLKSGVDGATRGLASIKGIAAAAWDSYRRPPEWTDFKDATGKFQAAEQFADHAMNQFADEIKRVVPDKARREAMTNWVEAAGDTKLLKDRAAQTADAKLRKGYELAQELTPEETKLAGHVREYLDTQLDRAIDYGMLEKGAMNYITHIHEKDARGLQSLINFGELAPNPAFLKKRVFSSYFEGEQQGFQARDKDIGFLTTAYHDAFTKALASRAYIASMLEGKASDGRPLAILGSRGKWVQLGPDEAVSIMEQKKRPESVADYRTIDHPALRNWNWDLSEEDASMVDPKLFEDDQKALAIQGDLLLHPEIGDKVGNILGRSRIAANPIGKAALKVSSTLKQSLLSFSGFHQTQEGVHALEHKILPANMPELDFKNPTQRKLVEHGLVVADFDGMSSFSEGVSGTELTRHIPLIGEQLHAYQDYLFRSYIPRLKMAMATHALQRNMIRYRGKLGEDQILEMTANQANAAFGGLNYKMMGRNKTFQDLLRLTLLAPDFLEARTRFAAQATKPFGQEQRSALLRGAAILYTAARVLNYVLNDKDAKWEPEMAFSVAYNGKKIGLRTVQGDILRLATEPRGFVFNRLNPMTTRPTIEFITGRDQFGRQKAVSSQAKDYLKAAIPIPAQGYMNNMGQNWAESLVNALGLETGPYRSPAEEEALKQHLQNIPDKPEDEDKQDQGRLHKKLEAELRDGKITTAQLWEQVGPDKPLTPQEAGRIQKQARNSPLENYTANLSIEQMLPVYEKASPAERDLLRPTLMRKRSELATRHPAERDRIEAKLEKLLAEDAKLSASR